jgi:hypothetical protein
MFLPSLVLHRGRTKDLHMPTWEERLPATLLSGPVLPFMDLRPVIVHAALTMNWGATSCVELRGRGGQQELGKGGHHIEREEADSEYGSRVREGCRSR